MSKNNWESRTELLIGNDKLERLENSHVLVAGLGGVGGYVAEQLCRAGIGHLTLIDHDKVSPTNRNRQIIALTSTEGKKKTEVLHDRLLEINPEIRLTLLDTFLNEDNIPDILENNYDYVADAIDTLTPKVTLLAEAVKREMSIVSSMGSGGKTDPSLIKVCEIENSHHCKFAYKVRKELHKRNIRNGINVVYSPEIVSKDALVLTDGAGNKRSIIGTISYMPAVFGCFMAAEIIRTLWKTRF